MRPELAPFEPVAPAAPRVRAGERPTVFTCSLCGGRFTHAGLACTPCPLRAGCDVVACPHCGFQFPRTSHAVEWVRRLFERRRSPQRSLSSAGEAGFTPAEAHDDGGAERGRQ